MKEVDNPDFTSPDQIHKSLIDYGLFRVKEVQIETSFKNSLLDLSKDTNVDRSYVFKDWAAR